ncbi:type VI secretion system-associated FHA domain protein TagH [Erwinia pyrifoliae]|uniref:type VI secretion system-associated FHA domain protein TagH n=1 Tax=Erwinia pyrifoliae TaxID=79967 RepID=UPI00220D78DB|nr:type VI secretion system-associated FHA domain protein TagH [Erwinia pyrifoliae]MCT2387356.1 type VI secretion system-associated FHA domain protein TagH [Erwinia pyrifoliae]MCU8587044.1 type VI secretion system-associated FHA domain protein TagH [Erwinia pyrifoliae]UWS30911.1 type VI secretion system-associated FHA domain protein TagH [Erwinia pyrifoliae]
MRLTLLQHPTDVSLTACDFAPPGGTIGRSPENHLVLPDADRNISRLQALIHVAANGGCRLTNQGSVTVIFHNGRPLARGDQVKLEHGDTIDIGRYKMSVSGAPQAIRGAALGLDPLSLFAAKDDSEHDAFDILQPVDHPAPHLPETPGPQGSEERAARQMSARLGIDPVIHNASNEHSAPRTEGPREQRLLAALLEGMGLDSQRDEIPLNEEQMYTTGRMLSLFSQGTVALLSSRSILKRGVKADMTMVLNEANNPFKILPSGKTVLMQIYQSQMPGFMAPERAVRDALVDLQAHQLGMIAGIRAIIAAMLQSFNPQRLQDTAQRDNQLPRIALSCRRKAALWDYFMRHYQNTSGDIEDDFHTLFGEAFLQAYDMEVNQYKDSQSRPEEG